MAYKLYYVENGTRDERGQFEHFDEAVAKFHTICRDEFKLPVWAADMTVEDSVTKIDYGRNSKWFEIEVTEDEPNS
ncbi:hypothetical protein A9Q68_10090 [Streptococcus bovimastitidis]|uniref:Uncharacterized protein n=1 Tax=Streptococcus bovimastitidis TaxID=1856638 RepID=A0A1L8MKB8_9STRE|nr:hypothetical protein [Streptococcus bovimastitidis]OJF71178.1 hypothetical protein A9Q68_10090 [Streptococcus bovimastitidis]